MAKIYYNEAEAAAKLHVSPAELAAMVRDGKLRAFPDGARKMYKVDDVDKLAGPADSEIELAPVDNDISLADADKPNKLTKEDTVLTSEGISIFDDEDLEIEAADPMAKTQIAPTLDEQVSVEGVGSGSGLLDLTRESDDTSLGEVLEHIDEPQAEVVGSSLGGEDITQAAYAAAQTEAAPVMPVLVEVSDAGSGAFGGMVVGMVLLALLATVVAVGLIMQNVGSLAEALRENIIIVLAGGVVVIGAAAGIGYAMGKSALRRQAL